MAFFGDGAAAQGAFHEALNLAAVWQLPVIFFCENNGYAEFSPASTQHGASLERRAAGYGIRYVAVDGNDVVATASVMERRWSWPHGPAAARPSSRRPPTAGTATTRATRSATGRRTRCSAWEARDPLLAARGAGFEAPASATTRSRRSSRRWPTSSTTRSRPARRLASPAAGHA